MWFFILPALCAALLMFAIYQHSYVVIAKRKRQILRKSIEKEREATTDIINLSRDTINAGTNENVFYEKFIEYVVRSMRGMGGAILRVNKDKIFSGVAVAGAFPPMKNVSPQVQAQLMSQAKKHTEYIKGENFDVTPDEMENLCSEKGFAFFKTSRPHWIHENFSKNLESFIIAPIRINSKIEACVIVTSESDIEQSAMRPEDGLFLVRLAATASLGIEVIRVFMERQLYEERLQNAREEGMVQVSTGIIHNIGNAVTVAKLAVFSLKEKIPSASEERPEHFILNEIIPIIRNAVASNDAQRFLREDPTGSQCLVMIEELLKNNIVTLDDAVIMLNSLSSKLDHISEIIDLQQRFVGELGTENMTRIPDVIESSIKIFEESFNKRGIKIECELDRETPEILADPSMLTQVFINILKNAMEALDADQTPGKIPRLQVKLLQEMSQDQASVPVAAIYIIDNGPGMSEEVRKHIFEFGFSTKRTRNGGYGLHSCIATIKKYSGKIEVASSPGNGATFKITIPFKRTDNTSTKKLVSTDTTGTAPLNKLP